MRIIPVVLISLASFTLILASPTASAQGGFVPPATDELIAQITARDTALFAAIFSSCDAARVGEMVTEDFEFYHDKWGQTARNRDEFVASIAGMCERLETGVDFKARRELVAESLRVYPMKDYGALETGSHRFFKLTPGKPDQLTETAQFTHLWKLENGQWRLARVLSFDHRPAP